MKHLFYGNADVLNYLRLGDTAVRIITYQYLADRYGFDYRVYPNHNQAYRDLWRIALKEKLFETWWEVPPGFDDAVVHNPNFLEWHNAHSANTNTVFEMVCKENGFDIDDLMISPHIHFSCKPDAKSVMIYPIEITDGNSVWNADFWLTVVADLKSRGYRINHIGPKKRKTWMAKFYAGTVFDNDFPETIAGLADCISQSSLAIGGNTGPSWVCMMSDIPQILFECGRRDYQFWDFTRIKSVIAKELKVAKSLDEYYEAINSHNV